MRIISWNVNGLRSCHRKGEFLGLLKKEDPDIVCLQELKAWQGDLSEELQNIHGYFSYFNAASKKGYAGVAIYTKEKPTSIQKDFDLERFDGEGRLLIAQYKTFKLINIYVPHGGRQKENLEYKLAAYDRLVNYLKEHRGERLILIGDMNIAHTEIDLARPKNNKNNIMFTPEERAQIDRIIELGFSDTFRLFCSEGEHYTWWPWLANARQRNLGWRIDYAFASKSLIPDIKQALILNSVYGSDHCPILMELEE